MPATAASVPVAGMARATGVLVLSERLDGYDTFLTGVLEVGTVSVPVRILTFDDVTVLRPKDAARAALISAQWKGLLHLPHGLRPREVPVDLAQGAAVRRRDLTALSDTELRYALTFLHEATTEKIRRCRVGAIVSALPVIDPLRETRALLISLDVGGTLGSSERTGLATELVAASPLDPIQARRIVRNRLHTLPELSNAVIDDLCRILQIVPSSVPKDRLPSQFRPLSNAIDVVRQLSYYGTVITLSNVTCLDADIDNLRRLFSPWITDHFPSCQIGYAKPDSRAFQFVAKKFNVNIRDMVHIGDNWECDVAGAVDAGARVIWVAGSEAAPVDAGVRRDGVLIAERLDEVVTLVSSIARSHA